MFISVKRFAELHDVSDRYIRKLIQQGKITELSWKRRGRGYLIDQAKAEQDMVDNISGWAESRGLSSEQLEPILNPEQCDQADRLEIQDQAADVACEGEEFFPGGYTHPWAIWAARYVGELFLLSPDRVTIERISKTEWRLRVDDLDDETGEPCPWSVDLTFDFHPDQEG
jgi:hypothetical protein